MATTGYKITIVKMTQQQEIAGKEWKQTGVNFEDKPEFGYTPEIMKTVNRETQIYEQHVESLDLPALIAVVNGMNIQPIPGLDDLADQPRKPPIRVMRRRK
jgi:hypothetical protein